MCNNNKKNKKFIHQPFKILGLISFGVIIGLLIAPSKGETIRSKLIYRFRFLGNKLGEFFLKFFSKEEQILNTAKIEGDKIVTESKEKANKLLKEINELK